MQDSRSSRYWPELDGLRGVAAAMMIANHVAVEGRSDSGLVDAFGLVGSFAPVLFFFLTGLGSGVQSTRARRDDGLGFLVKVAILFAADSFLWAGPGRPIGMDFLGFIGLSMVLLRGLRRSPRGGVWAVLIFASFVVLRFAVGPAIRPRLPEAAWARVVGFLLGINALEGFSYPPCPWMAYPFLGYALGRLAALRRPWLEDHRGRTALVFAGAAGLLAASTLVLVGRGAIFFRWGNMSLAYFTASLAAVGFCLALFVGLGGVKSIAAPIALMSLGGVRSFAVVPLHYALRAAAFAVLGPVVGPGSYLVDALAVLILSFAGSALVPAGARALGSATRSRPWLAWAPIGAATAAALVVLMAGRVAGPADLALRSASQLLLCLLLAWPARSPTSAVARRGAPDAGLILPTPSSPG